MGGSSASICSGGALLLMSAQFRTRFFLLIVALATGGHLQHKWEAAPGKVYWFDGCGLADNETRGEIAADLDHKKLKRHVKICLGHCNVPKKGCELTEEHMVVEKDSKIPAGMSDCDCLKCMMFCLHHGSYVDECATDYQISTCNKLKKNSTIQGVCDVDCSSTWRTDPLKSVAVLVVAMRAALWPSFSQ